jgi:hypothetical protein
MPERRPPPKKRAGQATTPRRFAGAIRDVDGIATFLGETPKQARAQVARGLLPYRRLGGRIVFLMDEIQEFLRKLPGVSAEEALANVAARNGTEAR